MRTNKRGRDQKPPARKEIEMGYVVKFNDGKDDWYFSRFGLWGLPEWVEKRKLVDARIFETRQEARTWIRNCLGGKKRYTVEPINA